MGMSYGACLHFCCRGLGEALIVSLSWKARIMSEQKFTCFIGMLSQETARFGSGVAACFTSNCLKWLAASFTIQFGMQGPAGLSLMPPVAMLLLPPLRPRLLILSQCGGIVSLSRSPPWRKPGSFACLVSFFEPAQIGIYHICL